MSTPLERILLVESDPEISDLILGQSLQPLGYKVEVVEAASEAIKEAVRFSPDVIIANLTLPGLSGKDLLVALSSQGLNVPVIVLANDGMESDIIQAFRLGAVDYLNWPVREAEVVSAVERVLKQVRAKREREQLAHELEQTNLELNRRIRELTTILAIGKAVTSITEHRTLFEKVVDGAVFVSEADIGWLLVKGDSSKEFILRAYHNLPEASAARLNKHWEDGLSTLVALSREPLSIHGGPFKRFKVSRFGRAALVVPVKLKNEVIGLLVVMRKASRPFSQNKQALLEAVADYASISLVNTKLFRALEKRAQSLKNAAEVAQINENVKSELLRTLNHKVRGGMMIAVGYVGMLVDGQLGALDEEQRDALRIAQEKLQYVVQILDDEISNEDKV